MRPKAELKAEQRAELQARCGQSPVATDNSRCRGAELAEAVMQRFLQSAAHSHARGLALCRQSRNFKAAFRTVDDEFLHPFLADGVHGFSVLDAEKRKSSRGQRRGSVASWHAVVTSRSAHTRTRERARDVVLASMSTLASCANLVLVLVSLSCKVRH